MTADKDLSARLLPCPFCGGEATWISGGPGCTYVKCSGCPAETGDGSIPRIAAAWNHRTGQLITLADHEAAVAKAVEASVNAENEACAEILDNEADDLEADASRFRSGTDPHHFRKNLANTARKYAAAIRSRGVAG